MEYFVIDNILPIGNIIDNIYYVTVVHIIIHGNYIYDFVVEKLNKIRGPATLTNAT